MYGDSDRVLGAYICHMFWMFDYDMSTKVPCPNALSVVLPSRLKAILQTVRQVTTADFEATARAAEKAVRTGEDDFLATGLLILVTISGGTDASRMATACQCGWFSAAMAFHRTRAGSRLPAQWWAEHASLTTEQTARVAVPLTIANFVAKSGMKDLSAIAADWAYAVEESVHVVRVGLWEGDAVPHPSRPFDGLEDAADLGHEGQAVHYH